jgi:hypothetical protein
MKQVSYNLCWLIWTSAVIFDNDQTAVYNQMIPSQCMILSAQAGVNEAAIKTQLVVLHNCEYRVKSAHGISPDSFQNDLDTLIIGLLQGSAAIGAMWTLLSMLLFTVLDSHFPPTGFVTPWPNHYTEQQGEGFVDKVTLWNASYYNTCIVAIVSQAAYKAQVWAQLVFVCGRWLNLLKCYWFAVSWQFKPTGEAM